MTDQTSQLRLAVRSRSLCRSGLFGPALLCTSVLGGCAVGPNYHQPAAPRVGSYTEHRLPTTTATAQAEGGTAQRLVMGQAIEGEWWNLFHSRPLDGLIATSLANNPSLLAAQNALLAARDTTRAQEGSFFPSLSGSFQATRERSPFGFTSGGTGSTAAGTTGTAASGTGNAPFSLLNASVSVSYAPDIFGGVRRQVEDLRAQAEDQRFALEATYLSLTANIVTAAVTDASLVEQIKATNQIIAAEEHELRILHSQVALGGIPAANELTQESQLAQTRATLPPLQSQLAQERNQLAAYEGVLPNQFQLNNFSLADLTLPHDLPVSLPSALVRQRPDIREAGAVLHEDTALVGVATANMLPQITLTGSVGHEALSAASLFTPQTLLWSLASGITQPLFQGGTLLFKRRAAIATMREAAATYQNTIVLAFQNVSDTLLALHYDASTLAADTIYEQSAQRSLAVTENQYRLGGAPYTAVLTAEQTYETAVIARIKASAQRYADTAALFQALGGGWWNRQDIAKDVQNCCGVLP
ncbi:MULTISPECIES: efflux transporter outer membrane subunit [Acidiphilium]|uniref:Efflux transporter, outer membrane factor (OMF) lipoprotein, NodT family n=1 Tax=Acidiphilium rubrum TaxID=526 RepID=A0A8G2CNJ4_ACIRU|nr:MULTISPECIES: efflux transporter outer membrane subunit [Acidiphilium]SIR20731.1 efflux transporter, outer membrane factor (OMF) lipoprotein, NodT family [Acidiphilium rubrum]